MFEPLPEPIEADLYFERTPTALPHLFERQIRVASQPCKQCGVVIGKPRAPMPAHFARQERAALLVLLDITLHGAHADLEGARDGLRAMPLMAALDYPLTQIFTQWLHASTLSHPYATM